MNHLNQLIVEGNATRLPETRITQSGYTVCRIPIAVDRQYKNAEGEKTEEVSFFDVETFGKIAEACAKYIQKGQGLRIVGHLKQDRWKDKDGKNTSRVTIVAHQVDFMPKMGSKRDDSQELKNLAEAAVAITEEKETTF